MGCPRAHAAAAAPSGRARARLVWGNDWEAFAFVGWILRLTFTAADGLDRFVLSNQWFRATLLSSDPRRPRPSPRRVNRLAVAIIDDAERRDVLKPGDTVVEATNGNTGIAAATGVAAEAGAAATAAARNHWCCRRDVPASLVPAVRWSMLNPV